MTTLRRIHQLPDERQILVVVEGDHVHVAQRSFPWHSWSPPLPCVRTDDDPADTGVDL